MKTNRSALAGLLTVAVFAAGCAGTNNGLGGAQPYPTPTQGGYATNYGVVEGIDTVNTQGAANNIGVGTVGGAIVGGLLGNQVGGGSGRKAATVAGAVGGAVVGNQVDQRRNNAAPLYDIRVRLDNGSYQTVRQESVGDVRVGNRVRVENGRVYRY